MKNSLEDFVKQNRDQFDSRTPSEKVWSNIMASVNRQGGWWQSVAVWRAAAVIFMALSGYLIFQRGVTSLKSAEVASIHREFSDVEMFYKGQIAEKVALIEDFENGYEDDHFTQDLQKLDAMYQVLREELKAKPSQQVKDALVLNMLVRIDLLNQQIQKLEDAKKPKEGEGTVSI